MKLKSTFKVEIEDKEENVNAIFTFKKPKANKILELQSDTSGDLKKQFYMLTDDLEDVQGLFHEDGKEVSIKEIKDLDLDLNFMLALIQGYTLAAFPKKEEDAEKKIS